MGDDAYSAPFVTGLLLRPSAQTIAVVFRKDGFHTGFRMMCGAVLAAAIF